MNVALFFGSFNPFHNGHLNLGNYLIQNELFDEVWYVVSPCNPLKESSAVIDENLRLEMLIGAIRSNNRLKATDVEFTMPIPSYTIDTLHQLCGDFPAFTFNLLIGSDNALVFNKWKDHNQILEQFPVYVYPRRGYNLDEVTHLYPQMKRIDSPYFDLSSTQIRELIQQKKDISALVHPFVNQFIIENSLYS